MKLNLLILIAFLATSFTSNSYAEEKTNELIYMSVANMLFPEESYSFFMTVDGAFYYEGNEKARKVGFENNADDLQNIIAKIKSLPGKLTSIKYYDDYGCPNDPEIGNDSIFVMSISGERFKDGILRIENIKKDCVWKRVDSKSKATISEIVDYFENARDVILNN